MNKKNETGKPEHEHISGLDDYELKPHYDLDYRKAKPNRFAGKVSHHSTAYIPKLDDYDLPAKVPLDPRK